MHRKAGRRFVFGLHVVIRWARGDAHPTSGEKKVIEGLLTWINDSIYAAGGDHIPVTWRDFSNSTGISAVLNLSQNSPTIFDGPPPDRFVWISVTDEREASNEERYLAGLFVSSSIREGRLVLIHCPDGRHRTRWVYVAYALIAGRKLKTVLNEVERRPWMSPYRTDEQSWVEFSTWLASQGR